MKSNHIVSKVDGEYVTGETNGGSYVFRDSQFFPAKDGTWLMVDWIELESGRANWYVTEGSM